MRPIEAAVAVVGIYSSMLWLVARNTFAAAAETLAEAQKRDELRNPRRRPIDF